MATKPPSTTAFIERLLAPLSLKDQRALETETREELRLQFRERWFLANAAICRRDAQHWARLHNSFYGDNSQSDCANLKFEAFEAVEQLILTPARGREHLRMKRSLAKQVSFDEAKWPIEWVAALASDEAFFAKRRA